MNGTITRWHVVRHPLLILRGFGPRCYWRCVVAVVTGRKTTFLDVALRETQS